MPCYLGEKLMFIYAASLALVAFALSGCAPRESIADRAYMPPDEYLRPFAGTVIVMAQDPRSPHLSEARTLPTLATCLIRLPAGGDPTLRRGLFLIELGGCNGSIDVNADPARRIIPAGYERTLASRDWTPAYERLAATAKWVGIAP